MQTSRESHSTAVVRQADQVIVSHSCGTEPLEAQSTSAGGSSRAGGARKDLVMATICVGGDQTQELAHDSSTQEVLRTIRRHGLGPCPKTAATSAAEVPQGSEMLACAGELQPRCPHVQPQPPPLPSIHSLCRHRPAPHEQHGLQQRISNLIQQQRKAGPQCSHPAMSCAPCGAPLMMVF